MELFKNRTLWIATRHGKEKVIGPILEKELGVFWKLADRVDTDLLGTFSGEIPRLQSPLLAAQAKCEQALQVHGGDLALASEGSFGPHPSIPFLPADEELLLLVDTRNNLKIAVFEISTQTNFAAKTVSSFQELLDFAERSRFPSHALIIRKSEDDFSEMQKGIKDENELRQAFHALIKERSSVYVETDMRAMNNPSRLLVIESAAQKLVEKIKTACPSCQTPGFSVVEAIPGLPCEYCGSPTRSTLKYLHKCERCGFQKLESFPHKKTREDPRFCDFCNP